jgi:hypothetical protein
MSIAHLAWLEWVDRAFGILPAGCETAGQSCNGPSRQLYGTFIRAGSRIGLPIAGFEGYGLWWWLPRVSRISVNRWRRSLAAGGRAVRASR